MICAQLKNIRYKFFVSGLLLAVMLLWPSIAQADETTSEYQWLFPVLPAVTSPLAVHTIAIHVGGSCCAGFELSTRVGYWLNGVCQYQRETPRQQVSACDVTPFGVFKLNGKRLEQLVGNHWTCAATHLHTFSDDLFDRYSLIENKAHHYTASFPASGHLSLVLCQ